MNSLSFVLVVQLGFPAMAPVPTLSVGIEFDSENRYRVAFVASDDSGNLTYNIRSLELIDEVLPPPNVGIHVRDEDGKHVVCDGGAPYYAIGLSPDLPAPSRHVRLRESQRVYSAWFDIDNLFKGFRGCANSGPEEWSQYKIVFGIPFSSISINAESDWRDVPEEMLRRLPHKRHPAEAPWSYPEQKAASGTSESDLDGRRGAVPRCP